MSNDQTQVLPEVVSDRQWFAALQKYSSRKFITMLVAEGIWIYMLYGTVLKPEEFIDLTKLTIGGYFLSNVFASLFERWGSKNVY